jgi:hypothetical protein
MPVNFLTQEQKDKYGKFTTELKHEQLAKYFLFDDNDKMIIFKRNGKHNHLGFALQLGTVRYLGTFLSNPVDVPDYVIEYLSKQLNIKKDILSLYKNSDTHLSHKLEIKSVFGYHNFIEQPYHWRLIRWLYNHTWLNPERPSIFFERTIIRCRNQKILLPGITVMERFISEIRERTNTKLWSKLASLPNKNQHKILENLLSINNKNHKTSLEILREIPTHESPIGFLKAIRRFRTIYDIGAHKWNISNIGCFCPIPPNFLLRN